MKGRKVNSQKNLLGKSVAVFEFSFKLQRSRYIFARLRSIIYSYFVLAKIEKKPEQFEDIKGISSSRKSEKDS